MRFKLHGHCGVDWAIRQRNIDHAKTLNLPKIKGPSLAVVGGGPSIREHVETLRNWRGDIWAMNGAIQWCRSNQINAALYSADASPKVADYCSGVSRAIFADVCDPRVFEKCPHAEVFAFSERHPGPTSACTAAITALDVGFREVVYFGCESSYEDSTHAYVSLDVPQLIKIECGGREYLTEPEFILQAEVLSTIIRTAPHVYSERGGGLLSAMVANEDYNYVSATRAFHDALEANRKSNPLGMG